jgi:sigma-B regulation protein RsbU (phosphoserine phosphatase)
MSEPPAKKRSRRTALEPSPAPGKAATNKRATAAPDDGPKPSRRGAKSAEANRAHPAPEPAAASTPLPAKGPGPELSTPARTVPLAMLVESMPDAFFCVDSQWHCTYVNPRMCELLGQPGPGLLGKDVRSHSQELAGLRRHLAMDVPASAQPPTRFRYTWPTRETVFDVRVRPVDGGLLIHLRDITSERHSQEELRKAYELLRSVIEGSTDAVFTKDPQGRYLLINEAGARALGLPAAHVVGKTDAELFPEQATQSTSSRDGQVLATGQTVTYEDVEQTPTGPRLWLSTKGALKDVDGKVIGLFGISRDITRHQRVDTSPQSHGGEAAPPLHDEQLLLALETAQVGLWDWDLQAARIRWSDNIASILGGVPGDTYEAFLQRILAEDRSHFAQKVAAAMQAPRGFEAEFRAYVPGGAPRWMRARVRVLCEGGQPRRMMGTLKDISREQQVEEESRRATDFQEQLIDIVSHDIRSPLGAIISWARIMALGGPPPEEQQRTFRRITSAALRIERLTRLLLDFARARLGGGITLEPRRCDLHELLQKVSHEFRIAYPDRTMQADQEGEPTVGTWDPDRLAQVVSNLVENALKYSPPDTLVRLTAKGLKDQVVLEVHNQGKPIPPELMTHIFEPFRRGPQSSRTAKTSYGLGLYIVQEIVLAHGGTIDVRSDIEEGTTFTVTLPRVPPTAMEMMRRSSPASPRNGL